MGQDGVEVDVVIRDQEIMKEDLIILHHDENSIDIIEILAHIHQMIEIEPHPQNRDITAIDTHDHQTTIREIRIFLTTEIFLHLGATETYRYRNLMINDDQ